MPRVIVASDLDNILLKVCPRCNAPNSRHNDECQSCKRRAKTIERAIKVQETYDKVQKGKDITKEEANFLQRHEKLINKLIGPKDLELLQKAPYTLPEESIVRPTWKNRLQFFIDRMRDQGKEVTTTSAAAKLLKFEKGGYTDKESFVNFATDHGIRPLMTADSAARFAAWNVSDILKLLHDKALEESSQKMTESGEFLSTLKSATTVGLSGTKDFMDMAKMYNVPPARSLGDKPELITWHAADVEILKKIFILDKGFWQLEDKIEEINLELNKIKTLPETNTNKNKIEKLKKDLTIIQQSETKITKEKEIEIKKLQDFITTRSSNKTSSRLHNIIAYYPK
jgi:hypothetical protein